MADAKLSSSVTDQTKAHTTEILAEQEHVGIQLIIEVMNGTGLDDENRVQQALRDCTDTCGATLLHIHTHRFSPQGITGVAVLAESHITVHTWPEIGYAAFDIFMCGATQPWTAVDVLGRVFDTKDLRVRTIKRGPCPSYPTAAAAEPTGGSE